MKQLQLIPNESRASKGYIVIITATRGKRNKEIKDSLHRFGDADRRVFEAYMRYLVTRVQVKYIVFGGARGGDIVALHYALKFRVGNSPRLVVVLPVDLEMQPRETQEVTMMADELIELKQESHDASGEFRNEIYKNRNRVMLTYRDGEGYDKLVLAFWTGQKSFSGTWSTIATARKMAITVEIAWLGSGRVDADQLNLEFIPY
jgi:hypothetical protein